MGISGKGFVVGEEKDTAVAFKTFLLLLSLSIWPK